VRVEGKLVWLVQGFIDLRDALGRSLQKQINQLAHDADAIGRRHFAQFGQYALVQKTFTRQGGSTRQECGVAPFRSLWHSLLAAVGRLSVQTLTLNIPIYDPRVHYHQIRDSWFGVRTPDGH